MKGVEMLYLDPRKTALVLIDLQNGIVGAERAPYSGPQVVGVATALAEKFRAAGAPVVLVNVAFAADFADALRQKVDQPTPVPEGGLPSGWSDIVEGLAQPGDIRVTKQQWGAFYGTNLDDQLRRRGVDTIVLGGIATNIGVESTARQAFERNYTLVLVEDATTSVSTDMHVFSMTRILPRLSRIAKAADIELRRD
jgi:nicotinamidase-related amidase